MNKPQDFGKSRLWGWLVHVQNSMFCKTIHYQHNYLISTNKHFGRGVKVSACFVSRETSHLAVINWTITSTWNRERWDHLQLKQLCHATGQWPKVHKHINWTAGTDLNEGFQMTLSKSKPQTHWYVEWMSAMKYQWIWAIFKESGPKLIQQT